MSATRSSWKLLPPPVQRESLGVDLTFSDADAARIMRGFVPEAMEDKWFIYFEDGWLFFHRSWTGALIYALRFENFSGGVRVPESWVSRDPHEHPASDIEADQNAVASLIDAFLLDKRRPFRAG